MPRGRTAEQLAHIRTNIERLGAAPVLEAVGQIAQLFGALTIVPGLLHASISNMSRRARRAMHPLVRLGLADVPAGRW